MVRLGVAERQGGDPLLTAWGWHVGGSFLLALRVSGACHLSPGSLGHRGQLALLPRGPARVRWPPGTRGLDSSDVVSDQGLSDVEGRPVVPPPMQPV